MDHPWDIISNRPTQLNSTGIELLSQRLQSIVLILALASNQATSGQGVAGASRRRAQEVDNDVTLDNSITPPIEPIADDPTDQPTKAPDFTEWVATAEPTSKPSGPPTSAPVKTSSLVINEATIAPPTEEAIAYVVELVWV